MYINGPRHEKTCLCHIRTFKRCRSACESTQSHQHLCFLHLDSILPVLAKSTLELVSVAEQAGLSITWSQTPKTGL